MIGLRRLGGKAGNTLTTVGMSPRVPSRAGLHLFIFDSPPPPPNEKTGCAFLSAAFQNERGKRKKKL